MPRTIIAMPRLLIRDFGTSLQFALSASAFVRLKTSKILCDQVNSSVSLWVKTSRLPAGTNIPALYVERAGSGNDIWKLEITTTRALRFTHRDTAGTLTQLTNATGIQVADGKWHMVTVTKAGTTIKLYVDGALDYTGTVNGTDTLTNSNHQVQVGEDVRDANTYLDGLTDEVWLFTRTLSATEIATLYYTGTVADSTSLVGHYKFDEGSGAVVIDSSGTQANGSISGATYSTDVVCKTRSVAS